MEDFLHSIRRIPQIVRVAINKGSGVTGSFIDPEWVLHYIHEGKWSFELESKSYRISPGDMVLIPPHLLHVVRPEEGRRLVQWVVHFNLFDRPFRPGDFPYAVTVDRQNKSEVEIYFSSLKKEWEKRSRPSELVACGQLLTLLGYYTEAIRAPKIPHEREGVHWGNIELAVRHIQDCHSDKKMNLSSISRYAKLSPNYLCRVFKNCLGVPVMKYLTIYRIQKAEELLLGSSLNCSEIAERIGFDGIHIFSRLFRKYRGMPPTDYRSRHKG